MFDIGKKKHKV